MGEGTLAWVHTVAMNWTSTVNSGPGNPELYWTPHRTLWNPNLHPLGGKKSMGPWAPTRCSQQLRDLHSLWPVLSLGRMQCWGNGESPVFIIKLLAAES